MTETGFAIQEFDLSESENEDELSRTQKRIQEVMNWGW